MCPASTRGRLSRGGNREYNCLLIMGMFITVPTDFVANISTYASGIVSDISPVATLIIGISLGLFLLSWVIRAIAHRKDSDI